MNRAPSEFSSGFSNLRNIRSVLVLSGFVGAFEVIEKHLIQTAHIRGQIFIQYLKWDFIN